MLLLLSPAFATAADCEDMLTLASELAAARDSDPAAAVERGNTALTPAEAIEPPCPAGVAMLLGGIATNLQVLGRSGEAVERAIETVRRVVPRLTVDRSTSPDIAAIRLALTSR